MTHSDQPINWEAVWEGLNWDDQERHQRAERQIMRQRARQYAAPVKTRDLLPEDARTLLTFKLADENYGVDVMVVRSVRPAGKIARVPSVPAFYRGVINLRGRIITVMDLRLFFEMAVAEGQPEPNELVVIQSHHLEIGLLAHQINGVTTVPLADIQPVEHMPFVQGMTKDRLVVINVAQFLEDERLIVGGVSEGG